MLPNFRYRVLTIHLYVAGMNLPPLFHRVRPSSPDKPLSLPQLLLVEICVLLLGALTLIGLGMHVAPHVLAVGLNFWPT